MKKPTTEHLLTGCLYFTTAKLERVLNRWTEEAFAGTGLAPNYAFAVMLINDKPGIGQTELAQILHLAPSTLTRFIDKLEAKGWVTRSQDGRQTLLQPTAKAKENHQRLADSWADFWRRYTGLLGVEEGNGLAQAIHSACERLEATER